ncbi:MAG: cupin domain-containing protein [Pseudomonadota bacterium]|nr:cupin domain-containing protein [Pseudomonadota bacterium]
MKTDVALPLLGGLSAAEFMRVHWQKKPLLVRAAMVVGAPGIDRHRLFALAAQDGVESRLIVNDGDRWSVRQGPIPRRALPPLAKPGWTLLVQGVDLHDDAAHDLLSRFRFIADARVDDAMFSFASDGGGVGPHIDSYDVFLLQAHGRRRWRIGHVASPRLRDDVPLKMLAGFRPRHDWLLEPGDMLYLPPGWAHEGTAVGSCITCSVGFRAPRAANLAGETLQRLSEPLADAGAEARFNKLYTDAREPATAYPARIPASLRRFADAAIDTALRRSEERGRALGEVLSEPKTGTWFERGAGLSRDAGVALDRRTRMLYNGAHVFINGESCRPRGSDAKLLRRLADERHLDSAALRRLGADARQLLERWAEAGWCRIQRSP